MVHLILPRALFLQGILLLSNAQSSPPTPTPTISLFLDGAGSAPAQASVITANPTSTVYTVGCAPTTDCGIIPGMNVTAWGTSTVIGVLTDYEFYFSFSCTVDGSAICVESAGGTSANFPGLSTETYPPESVYIKPIVVTAGAEKLSAATTTAQSNSSSGKSTTGASRTASGSVAVTGSPVSHAATSRVPYSVWSASLTMGLFFGGFNLL